jgi:parallel beta-helix repeat protein
MNKILTLTSIIVLALSILPAGFYVRSVAAQTNPKIRIEPVQIMKVPVGETFTVNVTVEDCVNVYAVQVYIRYDPDVLEAVSILEGPFLPSFGSTLLLLNKTKEDLEATPPYAEVRFVDVLLGDVPGANGSGLLFNVTFRVISDGSSHLHFVEYVPKSGGDGTYFMDSNLNEIYPELYDGFYGTGVVEWTGTVYIKADGSVDPPDAPILNVGNFYYTFTADIYGSIVVERDNIVIDGNGHLLDGGELDSGITLSHRRYVTIKSVRINNFLDGIWGFNCSSNIISRNNLTSCGISLNSSSNNTLIENDVVDSYNSIWLAGCSNNNISRNRIVANSIRALWLSASSNNIISGNNITATDGDGIWVTSSAAGYSTGNTIEENDLIANGCGIEFTEGNSNNKIYHNNFVNNARQVSTYKSLNLWDDGYPSGGNYWSDYTDVDLCYGSYQNQTGSDGIWDHPFIISENNTDRYPLVNPWTPISIYVQGIDVSHHQGDINWSKVYGAGYRFAFAKATEGDHRPPVIIDPNFVTNMENGREAGLLMGAYHLAHPETNNATDEALFFVSVASTYLNESYLRPALDLEQEVVNKVIAEKGEEEGKKYLSNWVETWISTVKEETGVEPIIYVGSITTRNYLNDSIAKYDLWIAHWTYDPAISPETGIWASWDFWQWSNESKYAPLGYVPGIAGNVDLDLFNGYMQRLYDAFTIPNVKVFNVFWENKTYPITVYSNSTVTHLVFNQTQAQISFNVTGSNGSKGYCNITIPKDLLKGNWTYTMDGETPSVMDISEDENATHSFIYFTYIHAGTFRIAIQGAWVVPEFPSTIILTILMLTTIILVVLTRNKRLKYRFNHRQ